LTKHVEQKPVPDIGLFNDRVDDLASDESEPYVEKVGTHFRADNYYQPVEYNQRTQYSQQNEPKPKENVNLLVDNIQGQ